MIKSIVFILLCSAMVSAQPVLTNTGMVPVLGEVYLEDLSTVIPNYANMGANQTWDFSNMVQSSAGFFNWKYEYKPICAPYNGAATICANNKGTFNGFPPGNSEHYKVSSNKMEFTGECIIAANSPSDYIDNMQILQFPFNYLDSFTDTFSNLTRDFYTTVTYDGYGTLITPLGTFNNVSRITTKIIGVKLTPIYVGIADGRFDSTNRVIHKWYKDGVHRSIASVDINNNYSKILKWNGQPTTPTYTSATSANYLRAAPLAIGNVVINNQIKIVPNPAQTSIDIINYNALNNAKIELLDATGKLLLVSTQPKIDVSQFAKGLYFIKIKNVVQKFVVQ